MTRSQKSRCPAAGGAHYDKQRNGNFYFQLSAPRADTLTFMLARQLSIRAIHCILGCPTDTLTFALLSLIFLPSLARTTLGVIIAQPVT
jgi:hypothetical protein